jgi:predicted DNA-binding transcriptional regulator AlpA
LANDRYHGTVDRLLDRFRNGEPEPGQPIYRQGVMTTSRTLRLVEIADLLGVSKQRAHQIAEEPGFPTPVQHDGRGRLWDQREVNAWAKEWRPEKPWR